VHVARAVSAAWRRGDNVVVSPLDHDANVAPWVAAAARAGAEVRVLPLDRADPGALDLDALDALVDGRTKLVAVGVASNGLGTIHDVDRVCAAARDVGALSFLDAVHYAPHGLLDVEATACDFMVASPYKFFGPHAGALFGRRALLDTLAPDKIALSDDGLPRAENCHMSRWELGTSNFEASAGVSACVDYVASLGDRFGGVAADSAPSRRDRLRAGFAAIALHEHLLKKQFLEGAAAVPGLSVHGLDDPTRATERTATFAVSKAGLDPAALVERLADRGVIATSGNHYCSFWPALGLDAVGGAARLGFLHYNNCADVARALEALDAA